MIKTKRNTVLLTLAALALAFISAALLFMVAPKRAAKADDGQVQTVISEYPDPTGWGVKDLEVGDTIAGTYIIMSYSTAGTLNFNVDVDNDRFYGLMLSQDKWKLCFTNDFTNTYVEEITMSESVVPKLITIAGGNDLYFYIPQTITGMYAEVDITGATLKADSYLPGTVKLVSPLIVSEPEQPEDPGTEPEQPGENSGTETENKKFDIGEWLVNAGENVSTWLGDNVGIATTGSTVLIVGAILIIIVLARRRR